MDGAFDREVVQRFTAAGFERLLMKQGLLI
jgi:hypothetical protein